MQSRSSAPLDLAVNVGKV